MGVMAEVRFLAGVLRQSGTVRNEILSVGNQDACRLRRYFLTSLCPQLVDEVLVNRVCVPAVVLRSVRGRRI